MRRCGRTAVGWVSTTLSTGCEPGRTQSGGAAPRRIPLGQSITFSLVRRLLRKLSRDLEEERWAAGPRGGGEPRSGELNPLRQAAATRHPQAWGWVRRLAASTPGVGLTLWNRSAYRWPVIRCRSQSFRSRRQCRSAGPEACTSTEREAREQAYVPAEQPSSPQGARVPPAHAHPCRPRHLVVAPPQGPQEPGGLTAGPPVIDAGAALLPPEHRLTDADSFRAATRGRRSASRTLVVHLGVSEADVEQPRVGLVVSKAVGNAVVRNRVKRRLRHLAREHVSALPGSAVLVVRALPAAAGASYDDLGGDLTRCLDRVLS